MVSTLILDTGVHMKKAIIVSASTRIKKDPIEPIPALDRYDGIFFRVIKKYLREGRLENTDIIIVSEQLGVLLQNERIPYHKPIPGKWGPIVNKGKIEEKRRKNIARLNEILKNYSTIYVNMGKGYLRLIDGFDDLTEAKIVYATGKGIGPKALHMKKWILSQ